MIDYCGKFVAVGGWEPDVSVTVASADLVLVGVILMGFWCFFSPVILQLFLCVCFFGP